MERDDHLRTSCFLALDVLRAKFGDDLPYKGGLDSGFSFGGKRIPFFSHMKGIHRAAMQRGPAALSINTSSNSPYDDEETDLGFVYAYRAGAIDQPDNRALRAAFVLNVPLVYFVGTRAGWYRPPEVHVAARLLDDDDGPMLDVLKGFHLSPIELPKPKALRPDPIRLAARFERFQEAS